MRAHPLGPGFLRWTFIPPTLLTRASPQLALYVAGWTLALKVLPRGQGSCVDPSCKPLSMSYGRL